MEVKKCPYCGKTILAIAKVCKHCGKSLEQKVESVPEQKTVSEKLQEPAEVAQLPVQQTVELRTETYPQSSRNNNLSSTPKTKVSSKIIIAALAVVVALIVTVVVKSILVKATPIETVPVEMIEEVAEPVEEKIEEPVIKKKVQQYAYINGMGVTLRAGYSTTSNRIATLKKDELVTILDSYYPSNIDEAICNTEISLYTSNGYHTYTLPKGKAVKIISNGDVKCEVSFVHPQYGKMTATVPRSNLESISGDKWYQIRRNSGETGWVFSKYVIIQ